MVSEKLGETYEIKVQEVCKNNHVILQGLVILERDQNISPTIYLNSFWEAYEGGVSLEVIVEKILEIYREDTPKRNVDISFFKEFEKVKGGICFKLISMEKNREILEHIPHLNFLDLAVCFYYAYQDEVLGCGSILIHNTHAALWNTDTEELWELSACNTPALFPWECSSMRRLLQEMNLECEEYIPMRILTNAKKVFGASCILYPGLLERIAAEYEGDFYVIPSSVHEVILLQDSGGVDRDYLREMIAGINKTHVQPEEVLSDQLYYYDYAQRKLVIA